MDATTAAIASLSVVHDALADLRSGPTVESADQRQRFRGALPEPDVAARQRE